MAEGVHTSMLAFESPLLLAVMALASAAVWLLFWQRSRTPYMLLLALGWAWLCLYWSLLAVSAGPAPLLSRADLAMPVCALGIAAAVALLAGKALLLRRMWRNGKAHSAA